MKRVFVNGYGSIGNRIAQFIKDDPQIKVVGVGKFSPDDKVNDAIARGFDVYVPQKRIESFKNYKIKGTIEDAISNCDLVIDGAPGGTGYANKKQLYEPKGVMAIYQGGESVFGDERVSDLLFNSRVNYKEAFGKKNRNAGKL